MISTVTTKTTTSPSPRHQRLIRNQYFLLLLLSLMVLLNIILLIQNFFPSSSSSSSSSSSIFDLRHLQFQQQQQPQSLEDKKPDINVVVEGGEKRTISSNNYNINDGRGQEEERRYNNNNNNNLKCLHHVETKTDTNDDTNTNIYTNHDSSSSSSSSLSLLESSSSLEDYIIKSNRIIITMPAKAAGSSLKKFTNQCTNIVVEDNFPNFGPKSTEEFLISSLRLPKIIASHVLTDTTLIDLIQHSSSSIGSNLIIHIYRDETSRLISGIKEVVNLEICRWTTKKAGYSPLNIALPDESYCMIDEIELIQLIKTRTREIGYGNVETLTCDLYQTIDNNMPRNIIFVHYTQVNQLQKLLSKHYCPELLELNEQQQQQGENGNNNNNNNKAEVNGGGGIVESNTSNGKPLDRIYVQLKKTSSSTTSTTTTKQQQTKKQQERVTLTEWLNEKTDFLEWTLKLKDSNNTW